MTINMKITNVPPYVHLRGDVNEDGKVDISDIVVIINIIANQ